jgi:hypothetical protein
MLFHSIGTKPSLRNDSYSLKTTDIQFDCDCWYNDLEASEHMSDNRTLFQYIILKYRKGLRKWVFLTINHPWYLQHSLKKKSPPFIQI